MAAQEDLSQRVRRILGKDADDPDSVSLLTSIITECNLSDDEASTMFEIYNIDLSRDLNMPLLKAFAEVMKYEGFNPRQMIKILMEKHARTEAAIRKYPESVEYNEMNTSEGEPVRVSNNMSFNEDIKFLCSAFITRGYKFNRKYCDFMKRQMALMKIKYDINTAKRRPGQTFDPKIVTISRIAASFPGVTVGLFHKGLGRSIVDPTILFPGHNLPRALFSPMMASAIPVHPDAPRAILMAIAVAIDDILHQNAKSGLQNMYNYFLASYNSEAITQKLKIIYCRDWNIVTYPNENTDAFRFTDDVKAARERAKALVSASRAKDPYLQTLMALI